VPEIHGSEKLKERGDHPQDSRKHLKKILKDISRVRLSLGFSTRGSGKETQVEHRPL